MFSSEVHLQLPDWLIEMLKSIPTHYPTIKERMLFTIQLAQLNIQHQSGGPFAATVFDMDTFELIAVGVNRVVPCNSSIAHAEMLAISTAQQQLQTFDLASTHRSLELVSSSEPCAMCFGALHWSGIRHLACGARDEDVRSIGFDEGSKHPQWKEELIKRDIAVSTDVCRDQAAKVLRDYSQQQGKIYNGRQ